MSRAEKAVGAILGIGSWSRDFTADFFCIVALARIIATRVSGEGR